MPATLRKERIVGGEQLHVPGRARHPVGPRDPAEPLAANRIENPSTSPMKPVSRNDVSLFAGRLGRWPEVAVELLVAGHDRRFDLTHVRVGEEAVEVGVLRDEPPVPRQAMEANAAHRDRDEHRDGQDGQHGPGLHGDLGAGSCVRRGSTCRGTTSAETAAGRRTPSPRGAPPRATGRPASRDGPRAAHAARWRPRTRSPRGRSPRR